MSATVTRAPASRELIDPMRRTDRWLLPLNGYRAAGTLRNRRRRTAAARLQALSASLRYTAGRDAPRSRNLADPEFEPSDDDLKELSRTAFADVASARRRSDEKLWEEIAELRRAALASLTGREAKAP